MVHDLLAKSGLPGCAGFSFFGVFFHGCFDDPAKLLALSSAVSLATPFEDHFLDGVPLVKGALTATAGELRAWSGVRLNSSLWLVITPGDAQGHTRASKLTLQVALPEPDSAEMRKAEGQHITVAYRCAPASPPAPALSPSVCVRACVTLLALVPSTFFNGRRQRVR